MTAYCDYCMSARSVLVGNVYCSRHHASMDTLDSGALILSSREMESTDHVSRLSIRCVLNGTQYYKLGRNDYVITPTSYLLINQGQIYRTAFSADHNVDMMLVAFKPGFAEQLLYGLVTPDDKLLDNPFDSAQPVLFFEQTYPQDPYIVGIFAQLRQYIFASTRDRTALDSLYTGLLLRLLDSHRALYRTITAMSPAKHSTKVELYRRLSIAKDYIDAHLHDDIHLDTVSRIACISKYHFLRLFKEVYGITPHRYITTQRLQRAALLLQTTARPVSTIHCDVGFEDGGSFSRLFRRSFGTTPSAYRLASQN